jgi:hypothetical protein
VVSRLTRTDSGWKRLDLVRGLPRSRENHATNGLALDPATGVLYVAQGGNTNMGAPSTGLAYLPEYALSGAILTIDLRRIGETTYDLPTLAGGNEPFGRADGRNQARLVPGGPVQVYAPGYRNPYDVVLTRAGSLYTVQNGAAKDWGAPPRRCANVRSEPGVREIDTLHLVRRGTYGGHPNPTRANRANTFDGQSPVAVADPVQCEDRAPSERGALASFVNSTNGLAEYTASNLGGAMRGNLLAASFDGWVHRLALDGTGEQVVRHQKLFPLLMPLDVPQPDDGLFPGTVWVARYAPGIHRRRPARRRGRRVARRVRPAVRLVAPVAPDMPRPRDHFQSAVVCGRLYAIGGRDRRRDRGCGARRGRGVRHENRQSARADADAAPRSLGGGARRRDLRGGRRRRPRRGSHRCDGGARAGRVALEPACRPPSPPLALPEQRSPRNELPRIRPRSSSARTGGSTSPSRTA